MDPKASLDGRKISSQLGFDLRTVQPVVSRYTDWAVRPIRVSAILREIEAYEYNGANKKEKNLRAFK